MTCLKPKLLWRKSEHARAETTIDHSTNELNSEDTVDSGVAAAVDVPGGARECTREHPSARVIGSHSQAVAKRRIERLAGPPQMGGHGG